MSHGAGGMHSAAGDSGRWCSTKTQSENQKQSLANGRICMLTVSTNIVNTGYTTNKYNHYFLYYLFHSIECSRIQQGFFGFFKNIISMFRKQLIIEVACYFRQINCTCMFFNCTILKFNGSWNQTFEKAIKCSSYFTQRTIYK